MKKYNKVIAVLLVAALLIGGVGGWFLADYIKTPAGDFECMKVRAASIQKHIVLCTFEAITTLEDAIRYKGTMFYADRDDLHDGAGSGCKSEASVPAPGLSVAGWAQQQRLLSSLY